MYIQRLSSVKSAGTSEASGLVIVGSFAPVHEGHFDAVRSAERALRQRGEIIGATTFVPNSDSYVLQKLQDEEAYWNHNRRVSEFLRQESGTYSQSYVDDLSGAQPPEKSISEAAIETTSRQLGLKACNLFLVVGTDQLGSMKPHLETNKAVCILRPGYEPKLSEYSTEEWFVDAVDSGRYVLAERENTLKDISSSEIRKSRKHPIASEW